MFDWRALGKSELLSKGEEDLRVADTHQGFIGHDAQVMSQILPGHSEYGDRYGVFEGHRKEDITSKVSDPPFTNLNQRNDSDEKPMLVG